MRKLKYAAAIMMLSVMVCGCQKQTKTVSLYDRGLEIASSMEELTHSDVYNELLSAEGLQEAADLIKEGDYTTPTNVYKVTLEEDLISMCLSSEEQEEYGIQDMSPFMKKLLGQKAFQSIPVMINSRYGSSQLAAMGTYTANMTFVSKEINENLFYVYMFEKGLPVVVDFSVGENHSVFASGHYIMSDEFEDSVDGIQKMFNSFMNVKCSVELVEK